MALSPFARQPFTMQDVVNDVLLEMRFAPGRDVQIHLQDSIIHDASRLFRTLMRKYVWRDFMSISTLPVNANTGLVDPVELLDPLVHRFSDVIAVYKQNTNTPLPMVPAIRPAGQQYRGPVVQVAGHPFVFVIRPVPTTATTIHLWSRKWQDEDFTINQTVPFYRDLLSVGTALQLSTKAGINKELTQSLKDQFNSLLDTYRDAEIMPYYETRPYASDDPGIPNEWFVTP